MALFPTPPSHFPPAAFSCHPLPPRTSLPASPRLSPPSPPRLAPLCCAASSRSAAGDARGLADSVRGYSIWALGGDGDGGFSLSLPRALLRLSTPSGQSVATLSCVLPAPRSTHLHWCKRFLFFLLKGFCDAIADPCSILGSAYYFDSQLQTSEVKPRTKCAFEGRK